VPVRCGIKRKNTGDATWAVINSRSQESRYLPRRRGAPNARISEWNRSRLDRRAGQWGGTPRSDGFEQAMIVLHSFRSGGRVNGRLQWGDQWRGAYRDRIGGDFTRQLEKARVSGSRNQRGKHGSARGVCRGSSLLSRIS